MDDGSIQVAFPKQPSWKGKLVEVERTSPSALPLPLSAPLAGAGCVWLCALECQCVSVCVEEGSGSGLWALGYVYVWM